MLGDDGAATVDEGVGSGLLGVLVIPGVGVTDFHGDIGNDGLDTKVVGGEARDDFGVWEGTDVADLLGGGGISGDHFLELHTSSDTSEVAAFIDGSEGIVEVGLVGSVGLGAGGMAELNFWSFLGGSEKVGFVTKGIGED